MVQVCGAQRDGVIVGADPERGQDRDRASLIDRLLDQLGRRLEGSDLQSEFHCLGSIWVGLGFFRPYLVRMGRIIPTQGIKRPTGLLFPIVDVLELVLHAQHQLVFRDDGSHSRTRRVQ